MSILIEQDSEVALLHRGTRRFLLAGLLATLAIVTAIFVRQGLLRQTAVLNFVTESAQDISKGQSVKIAGFKVGAVDEVTLRADGRVEVQLEIDAESMRFVTRDAVIELRKEGLVGSAVLEIMPGKDRTRLAANGAEALDMLQAMNTGHDGSMTTIQRRFARRSEARPSRPSPARPPPSRPSAPTPDASNPAACSSPSRATDSTPTGCSAKINAASHAPGIARRRKIAASRHAASGKRCARNWARAEALVREAETMIGYTMVRAPFAGVAEPDELPLLGREDLVDAAHRAPSGGSSQGPAHG